MLRHLLIVFIAVVGLVSTARAEKVTVGLLRLSSSGPVFIAQQLGYFQEAGLEVELRFFDAAQPVAVAALAGSIDLGVTAFTAGFYNLARDGALKVIAAQSREEPGYKAVAYLVTPKAYAAGFNSVDRFPGHRVAITHAGSSFHYALGLLAQKQGFDLASIDLALLQSIPNMITAFRSGHVEAMLLPSSSALPLIESGEARALAWVGDLTPWQSGAVFTAATTLGRKRPAVEKFIRAYRRGTRAYYDAFLAQNVAGQIVGGTRRMEFATIIGAAIQQAPEQLARAMPFVDPEARLMVRDISRQVAWYQQQGAVGTDVKAADFIDLSFIDRHLDLPD